MSSDGYCYIVKKSKDNFTYWYCCARSKNQRCPASVTQTGDTFRRGKHGHNHAADSRAASGVKVSAKTCPMWSWSPSQQSSEDMEQNGAVQESEVVAIRELKDRLVNLESFYIFAKYVKTEIKADGRRIYTGRAKCQQNKCKRIITFDNSSRGNLKKHYNSMHKELAKQLGARILGISRRGRPRSKHGFSKKSSVQLCPADQLCLEAKLCPTEQICLEAKLCPEVQLCQGEQLSLEAKLSPEVQLSQEEQLCLEEPFTTTKLNPNFHPDVARKLWSRWFVDTMMPPSITDHPTTKLLLGYLCPEFDVPGRSTLARDMNNTYNKLKTNLCDMLCNIQHVATTADSWTAHSRAFLSMTVHWIDKATLARRCGMLACREVKKSQSNLLLPLMICEVHREFGLQDKVVATTTDNAANCTAFMHSGVLESNTPTEGGASVGEADPEVLALAGRPTSVHDQLHKFEDDNIELPRHFRCCAHTVNLLVTEDLEKASGSNHGVWLPFKTASAKAQSLWNLQNKSCVVASSIKSLVGRTLKTFCGTRWNSYYDSVKTLMEVLNDPAKLTAINGLLSNNKQGTFEEKDKQILSEYLRVMEPVAVCLDTLQTETNTYMGAMLPTLEIMRIKLEKLKTDRELQHAEPLVDALLGEGVTGHGFQSRFSHLFQDSDALMATALHPHYTLSVLRQFAPDQVTTIRDRIIREVTALLKTEVEEQTSDRDDDHHMDDVDILFSATTFRVIKQEGVGEVVRKVLEAWKRIKIGTPLSHSQFPSVHREAWLSLFRKYNTPLPSSAAMERLFGSAGNILEMKRSTLTNENFEKLVFMRGNMKLLGYQVDGMD